MTFTLFDPVYIDAVKKLKLQSFNERSYQTLIAANECYESANKHAASLSGKSFAQHRKSLIKDVKKIDAKAFRLHLSLYQNDCNSLKEQAAYVKQQEILNQVEWQEKCSQMIPRSRYIELQNFWQRNMHSSHYTSEGLYLICTSVLPLFKNFLQLGYQELAYHKGNLTQQLDSNLTHYLHALAQEIKGRQELLCDAMISRLHVASKENNLHYDDVMHYVVTECKAMDIALEAVIKGRNSLTPELFCYFHRYLAKYGTSEQLAKVSKLSWFQENSEFSSQQIDKQWVIIPKKMQKYHIPYITRKKFAFFYIWQNWRGNFFKENFYHLVKLRCLEQDGYCKPMALTELLEGNAWRELLHLEREIVAQCQQANNFVASFLNRIIFPKITNFYADWHAINRHHLQILLQKKLSYAEILRKELQKKLLSLDLELLTTTKTQQDLIAMISDIEKSKHLLTSDERKQWLTTKQIFETTINLTDNKNMITQTVGSATNNIIIKIKQGSMEENPIDLLDRQLARLSKNNMLHYNLPNFEHSLNSLLETIKNVPSDHYHKAMQDFWVKFFTYYLRTCIDPTAVNSENISHVTEALLQYSPKYFQERVFALEQKRKCQSAFVYHTQCRAMLFTLNTNFPSQTNIAQGTRTQPEQLLLIRAMA
jgi:hypothetical protein